MNKTINFKSIFKQVSILITTMLAIGVIIIPIWGTIQAEASQKGYNNLETLEGILNINYNDKTNFVSAINNLKFLKLKQEIGINSITGYTIENNNILPFVLNGQSSEINQNGVILLNNLDYEFKSGYTSYLKELKAIKENKISLESPVSSNQTNQTNQQEKPINPIDKNQVKGIKSIISSYSNNDLDIAKNKTKWFNNSLYIDKITISGSIKSLNLITNNRQIKPTIKTSELTNLLQIEKEFKEKQLVLENIAKPT